MTIREVIDRVLAYHPQFPADYEGCDDFKCGYPEDECTGIVSALVPTVDVIRKTIDAGANLLLFGHTHEALETYDDGLYILNPGSCSGFRATCGLVDISPAGILTNVLHIN